MKTFIMIILITIIFVAWLIGYKVNKQQFIPLALTATIAVCGWFIGHQLSVDRDRINKRSDIRIQYLISAYQRLANASMRQPKEGSEYFRDMEAAISDIQLFGSEKQINDAKEFMDQFEKEKKASLDILLNNFRNDLRKDLKLSEVEGNVQWFRPEGAPEIKEE